MSYLYDVHNRLPIVSLFCLLVAFIICINNTSYSDSPFITFSHSALLLLLALVSVLEYRDNGWILSRQLINMSVMLLFGILLGEHAREATSDIVMVVFSFVFITLYYGIFYKKLADHDLHAVLDDRPTPASPRGVHQSLSVGT